MDKEYSVCLDIVIEHLTELKLGGMVGTVREAKETIIKLEQELLQLSAKQTTTQLSKAPETPKHEPKTTKDREDKECMIYTLVDISDSSESCDVAMDFIADNREQFEEWRKENGLWNDFDVIGDSPAIDTRIKKA